MADTSPRAQAERLLSALSDSDDPVGVLEAFINLSYAAARSDLARKVLEVVEAQQVHGTPEESTTATRAHNFAVNDTLTALRELFAKGGD